MSGVAKDSIPPKRVGGAIADNNSKLTAIADGIASVASRFDSLLERRDAARADASPKSMSTSELKAEYKKLRGFERDEEKKPLRGLSSHFRDRYIPIIAELRKRGEDDVS